MHKFRQCRKKRMSLSALYLHRTFQIAAYVKYILIPVNNSITNVDTNQMMTFPTNLFTKVVLLGRRQQQYCQHFHLQRDSLLIW